MPNAGMCAPGLTWSGRRSQARDRRASFGSRAEPRLTRPPTCVRSGPMTPAVGGAAHGVAGAAAAGRRRPSRPRGRPGHGRRPGAGPRLGGEPALEVVVSTTTTSKRHQRVRRAAVLGAHAAKRPGARRFERQVVVRPGIMSTLPAIDGIQKEWMTLSLDNSTWVMRPRRAGGSRWPGRPRRRRRRRIADAPPPLLAGDTRPRRAGAGRGIDEAVDRRQRNRRPDTASSTVGSTTPPPTTTRRGERCGVRGRSGTRRQ